MQQAKCRGCGHSPYVFESEGLSPEVLEKQNLPVICCFCGARCVTAPIHPTDYDSDGVVKECCCAGCNMDKKLKKEKEVNEKWN